MGRRSDRDNMKFIRSRSIGTKVTEAEYKQIVKAAKGVPLSEYVRSVVLAAVAGEPTLFELALMSELKALRSFVVNMGPEIVKGTLTVEKAKELLERADATKAANAKVALGGHV